MGSSRMSLKTIRINLQNDVIENKSDFFAKKMRAPSAHSESMLIVKLRVFPRFVGSYCCLIILYGLANSAVAASGWKFIAKLFDRLTLV